MKVLPVHVFGGIRLGIIGTAVAVALAGCASGPRVDSSLDSARSVVAAAHADGRVKGDANAELAKADTALASADSSMARGAPLPDVDHQAYLADRYARAAEEHGKLLESQAAIADQDNRRNAVLLQARDADVRQATAVAQTQRIAADSARAQAAGLELDLAALQAKQTDRGIVVTLGDVLFATGRSDLQGTSDHSIDTLTTYLKSHPERNVRIEGYTDSVGGEDFNQGLSERRASSVANALERRGIDAQRVMSQGYGESFPVASNASATGRQENRRVEVVISDGDGTVANRTR